MPLDPVPTPEQVSVLTLAHLVPSPFNPRSGTDTAQLADLADSIRTSGLQQPIVVRPLPADHQGRQHPSRHEAWEIVFGHRRAMAAGAAGLTQIPAIVRDLTDQQVIVAQAIENLQREDLSPMDEARGYRQLLDQLQVPVDEIVQRVGRKRTQIYARLKLLELVPEAVEALERGEIGAEVAQLVARIPLPKLQVKALAKIEELRASIYQDRDPSYREIRTLLVDEFTLQLSKTIFPLDDATLLPAAGSCLACPKRSGANLDLFGDIVDPPKTKRHWDSERARKGEEICTDPECFAAKKAAQLARVAAELEAKGKTVVTGAAAKRALKIDRYSSKPEVKGEYVALADVKAELKKVGKDKAPAVVTLQDPASGRMVQAVKKADLAAAGVKVKEEKKPERYDYAAESRKREAEQAKREVAARVDMNVRRAVFDQLRAKIAATPRSAFDLGLVAAAALAGVEYSAREALAKLWGHGSTEKLGKALGSMSAADLNLFLMDCALVNDLIVNAWRPEPADTLHAAARHYKIDADAIRAQVKEQMDAADADAAKKAAAANAKAKKGKK
jgi:ParB/RepB/Spo0J family partition protein